AGGEGAPAPSLPSPLGRGAGGEGQAESQTTALHANPQSLIPNPPGQPAPQTISLYADWPIFNQQDYRDGVFGTYWRDVAQKAEGDSAPSGLRDAGRPRIDVLQGADQKLYVRTWRAGKLEPPVPLPIDGSPWEAFAGTPDAVPLAVEQFIPAEKPDVLPSPLGPEKKAHKRGPQRQAARVRLTVDGVEEEFWLCTNWEEPLEKLTAPNVNLRHVVQGKGRSVAVALRQDAIDLGLDVRLHQFRRVLYPGTDEASQYYSRVDVVDRPAGKPVEYRGERLSDQKIAMNSPLDFVSPHPEADTRQESSSGHAYRLFQSSFQGPQPPDKFGLDRKDDEDLVYISYLSVASDPGRGLKYAGCILIVAGVFLRYFVRIKGLLCLAALCVPLLGTSSALAGETLLLRSSGTPAADSPTLDWSAWQRLPVFYKGRVMPLDSFARAAVKEICGTSDPTKSLPDRLRGPATPPRDASQLLFAWLAEPEVWEGIAFLPADDEDLRRELLEVPDRDEDGRPLRYVSPRQVAAAEKFRQRLVQLDQRRDMAGHDGGPFQLSRLDQKVNNLYQAYATYRQLTFDPLRPVEGRNRFLGKLGPALQAWNEIQDHLLKPPLGGEKTEFGKLAQQAADSAQKLTALADRQPAPPLAEIGPPMAALEAAIRQLAARMADLHARGRGTRYSGSVPESVEEKADVRRARALLEMMAGHTGEVARLVAEARAALYDDGLALRLLPSMDPATLEADRYRNDDQPWLAAQMVLLAPEDMLARYPQAALKEVRQAYQEAVAEYRRPETAERPERFAAAIERFAAALREMGLSIEPDRRNLPIREREYEVLDATAYPPAGSTDLEVLYNHLDPFFWSAIVCAAAAVCLCISFGPLRKPMFWSAVALAAAVEALILTGLLLRGWITGWVPLTGMFETIVFVAMCLVATGIALTLLPPREIYARRPVLGVGLLLALAALTAAYLVPAFHREIDLVKAVLRSNYWLAIHVTTIVAAYGEAAMACGLGMSAILCYLFGRYGERGQVSGVRGQEARKAIAADEYPRGRRTPPAICAILGPMIYRLLSGPSWAACGRTSPGAGSGAGTRRRSGPSSPCWST
ncbi:MAG: hypothetical protein ABR915_24765, partial [Thermoguttaceae bacterium]